MLANPRHEAFAQAFVISGNASAAWREATGKTTNADVNGPKWLVRVGIAERIAELRRETEKSFSLTREEWLARLQANADGARDAGDRMAERCALREVGLSMGGWYAPQKQQIDLNAKPLPGPSIESLLDTPNALETLAGVLLVDPQRRAKLRVLLDEADAREAAGMLEAEAA